MVTRTRKAGYDNQSGGPRHWSSTPYVKAPNKKLKPVHDPHATSMKQDHTGHGCSMDPTVQTKTNNSVTRRDARTVAGRQTVIKTSSAKAGDANTRVCPTCKAVVKGNGWHLSKHMARHK